MGLINYMNKATLYISGIIGSDTTLLDVIRQFKSFDNPTEVVVHVDSPGGSVDDGMSIYNYLRNLNLPITTIATQAYSIAASIFMAGDVRQVLEGEARLMLHFPWAQVQGGSEVLEGIAKELRTIEKDFIAFYSNYTSIDKVAIEDLLKNETFLSANEAFDLNLATEMLIPLAAVALYNSSLAEETITKENTMNKKETFMKAVKDFFSADVTVNALMVQDANGVEINFPELGEDDEIVLESIAEVDGAPAEGEYTAVNGDVWVFEAGVLKEIRLDETEEAPSEDEVPAEEVAEVPVAEVPTEEVEETFNVETIIAELSSNITTVLRAEFSDENETLRNEIVALKKLMGSEDTKVSEKNTKNNTNKANGRKSYLTALRNKN